MEKIIYAVTKSMKIAGREAHVGEKTVDIRNSLQNDYLHQRKTVAL